MVRFIMDHKFQWPLECLNCQFPTEEISRGKKVVTKRVAVQNLNFLLYQTFTQKDKKINNYNR